MLAWKPTNPQSKQVCGFCVGVKLTEHEADVVPPARLQVLVSKVPTVVWKVPTGVLVNVTTPVGLEAPLALVSVTMAVHLEA